MATVRPGIGTYLKRGDGAQSEAFTTVAKVRDINGPNKTSGVYDSTTMDSTDYYREVEAGLKSGGEITFNLLFDPNDTQHAAMDTDFENRTKRNWQLVPYGCSPAKAWSFAGIITGMGHVYPLDGLQACDVTITTSGKPTLAAAS